MPVPSTIRGRCWGFRHLYHLAEHQLVDELGIEIGTSEHLAHHQFAQIHRRHAVKGGGLLGKGVRKPATTAIRSPWRVVSFNGSFILAPWLNEKTKGRGLTSLRHILTIHSQISYG